MATAYPQTGSLPRRDGSKRTLWIWVVVAICVLFAVSLWECGSYVYSTFHQGWTQAGAAAHHFHEELNAANYEQICSEADPGFQVPAKHDQLVNFLTAVHTKLGNATSEKVTNINFQANTNGRFVVATFQSTFERGSAAETIVWRRDGDALRLYHYNIDSDAFILH